jgi:hypothetical protein
MSRYSLRPLPHRADLFEVAVGWDSGLSTYFAIMFGAPDSGCDPAVMSWQGQVPCQISTVAALESALSGCAEIPPKLLLCLVADKLLVQSRLDQPFSEFISGLLGNA